MAIRRAWSEYVKSIQEDECLRSIMQQAEHKKWTKVSAQLCKDYGIQRKTPKQCRDRWNNHLDPDIQSAPWTKDEERILLHYHSLYGNKWAFIASHLHGRPENVVKNHFYSTIRRNLRRIKKAKKRPSVSIREIVKKPEVLREFFDASNDGFPYLSLTMSQGIAVPVPVYLNKEISPQ